MKKCYRFTEYNDWEGETWNCYIDMTEEEYSELSSLISNNSSYKLSEQEYDADTVNTLVNNATSGYYDSDEYLGEFTSSLPTSTIWDYEDPFYKGRIREYCE